MKILKKLAIVLVVLILIGLALVAQGLWRFDLYFNPVSAYIMKKSSGKVWGTRVPMVPKPFPLQSSQVEIEHQLGNSGFVHLDSDKALAAFPDEVSKGHEVYFREANTLVCNVYLYVILSFEQNNKLLHAEGTSEEQGCL